MKTNIKEQRRTLRRIWDKAGWAIGIAAVAFISLVRALAQTAPQPVLTIAPFGTNQFKIAITNAISTTNYVIQRTLSIGDPEYQIDSLFIGTVGQSNFTVDMGIHTLSFFRATLGSDADGDKVPDWADPQPLNGAISNLVLTIDSPTNGAVLQ